MKRTGPIKRRTPLRSNAARLREQERRTTNRRRQDPEHEEVLAPRLARARAEASRLAEARAMTKARADGRCEANWSGVCPAGPHRGHHAHHVILRSQGGPDEAWNLLYVCRVVHDHAHNVDRAGAEARGIIARGSELKARLQAPLPYEDPHG